MDSEVDSTVKVINTCVLVILLTVSLVGNSLLIFTTAVATSRSRATIGVYVLSMAAFGLLECSLTMSLATGFSIEGSWVFGEFLMGFNCCFTQLQNIGVILTIMVMSLDRYFIVCKSSSRQRVKNIAANYAVLYTWAHAFVISFPLLFYNESNLQIAAFVKRSLCGLTPGVTKVYIITVIITSICVPTVTIVLSFTAIFWKSAKRRKSLRCLNPSGYANYLMRESDISIQAHNTNYVLLLFIIFVIFKLPYLVIDISTQSQPVSTNGTLSEQLQEGRFYLETALVWLMFCFSAIFPILTFAWFTEHKNRIWVYLCCGCEKSPQNRVKNKENLSKSHDMKDNHSNRRVATSFNWGTSGGPSEERQWCNRIRSTCYNGMGTSDRNVLSKCLQNNNMNVPVLYATADGLHLLETNSTSANGKKLVKPSAKKDVKCTEDFIGNCGRQSSLAESEVSAVGSRENEQIPNPMSDRRIDVLESNVDIQSEGDYLRCGTSFSEDDTETELNTSANSMTLILPNFHTPSCQASLPSLPRGRNKIPDPWGAAR